MIGFIIGGAVLVGLIIIIFVIGTNKFKFSNIKLDKAEEDIDIYLFKKYELLDRCRPIVKKSLKTDEFLSELDQFKSENDNMGNHNLLKSCYNELFKTIDENEKLLKSKTLIKILDELNENEELIVGSIRFYNDSVVEHNQLVVSFPTNLVGLFTGNKQLEFYNNEKRQEFEILKKK